MITFLMTLSVLLHPVFIRQSFQVMSPEMKTSRATLPETYYPSAKHREKISREPLTHNVNKVASIWKMSALAPRLDESRFDSPAAGRR
jgi:hypothetical protein